jgi:uncharacterized protein
MNVYFALNGITFVWDDEKARNNPSKHGGITFQQAAEAFFDPIHNRRAMRKLVMR